MVAIVEFKRHIASVYIFALLYANSAIGRSLA